MRCPVCKRPTTWQQNPFRPFCSERCRLIDLDNWFSERYRISGSSDNASREREPQELAPASAPKEKLA